MPALTLDRGSVLTVFSAETIPQNSSLTSEKIDVRAASNGHISFQFEISYSTATPATITAVALMGINGQDHPYEVSLASNFIKTSGDNSDGKTLVAVTENYPIASIQLKMTETANISDVTVSGWLYGT